MAFSLGKIHCPAPDSKGHTGEANGSKRSRGDLYDPFPKKRFLMKKNLEKYFTSISPSLKKSLCYFILHLD